MMKIKLFDPIYTREMKYEAIDALQNDQWTNGESVEIFEEEFAKFIGARFGIAVNSGTSALYISILACTMLRRKKLGIRNRKMHIITTPFSFIATTNSILLSNNEHHFTDIDDNLNLNIPNSKLSNDNNLDGVIPVCLHGHKTNIDDIYSIAKDKNMFMISDCCQYHAKNSNIGDTMCFSFYPSKNMTICMDGGMIATDNEEIRDLAISIRDCGRDIKNNDRNSFPNFGWTMRMASVGAAIGIEQLKFLDTWNEIRRKNAEEYFKNLNHLKDKIRLPIHAKDDSVWHIFELRTRNKSTRDNLIDYLKKNDIETGIHYSIPIHLQQFYKNNFGYYEGRYPVAERIANTTISLPVHPNLTEKNIEYISSTIKDFYGNGNRKGSETKFTLD